MFGRLMAFLGVFGALGSIPDGGCSSAGNLPSGGGDLLDSDEEDGDDGDTDDMIYG